MANTERNETIRQMWKDRPDLTAAEIGAQLGLSKNAVLGVLNRSGLLNDSSRGAAPQKPRLTDPAPLVADVEGSVGIMKLKAHHCRWPVGRGADGLVAFCGVHKLPKSSYCQEHFTRSRGSASLS